jgi:hypothetical protein
MAFGWNRPSTARPANQPGGPRNAQQRGTAEDWPQSLPTSEAREGGESMWEAWQEESRRMDLAFAETQPSDPIPLSGAAAPAKEQRFSDRWVVDDVLVLARRANRVCPRPLLWSALYVLLEGDRYDDLRPPPVQPAMWSKLSNLQRRLLFRDHIEWADRHRKLDELARYIAALAEPDWLHMGES